MSERQFSDSDLNRKKFNMNWNIVQDRWLQLKGKVTAHWDKLDSINTTARKGEEVAGEIQETVAVVQDQAKEKIEQIKDTHKE
jgi:uncharacterized protein YjbJ (UPF0337 family)